MTRQPMYIATCHATHPRMGRQKAHGARIGSTPVPLRFTRLIDDVESARPGRYAFWCIRCGKASEFEPLEEAVA